MAPLPLTDREADLLHQFLTALRPVIKGREQYREKRKPHDAETWGDVWQWAFRSGVAVLGLEPLIRRLRDLEFADD
jgi:hypothetical protein